MSQDSSNAHIIQGDCHEVFDGLERERFRAVITDPPYGISYKSGRRPSDEQFDVLEQDEAPAIDWLPQAYRLLKDGSPLVVFCRWDVQEAFRIAIEEARFEVRSHLVWDRVSHGLGDLKAQFAPQHDVMWFATKGAYEFPRNRPTSVFREPRVPPGDLEHPTQKPVGLMRQLVDAVVHEGPVLDPFAGSGSTGVAAVTEGFEFLGIELDGEYANLARERLSRAVESDASAFF